MVFLRILGIVLIAVSVILLVAVPIAGIIGILFGSFCIIRSSPKLAEKIGLKLAKAKEKSERESERLKQKIEEQKEKQMALEAQIASIDEVPITPIRSRSLQELSAENRTRMEKAGLKLYVWSTCGDERVCDACKIMDDKLCLWADPTVYSRNKGKEWIPRPTGASLEHPGEKDSCRCTSLSYEPELLGEL